jgi:DNA-binding response OmpR family regulator
MGGYRFDRLRILIVDDNVHMRKMLAAIVRALGVTNVYESPDGTSGWETLRAVNPDIVLLDWMMPGMSGLEFVRQVRTSPESPNPFVPVIMLTGHTQADRVRQARDAGTTEFMAKPISAKGLLARITAVIESPRSFVRTPEYFGPCRRRRKDDSYKGPDRRVTGANAASDQEKAESAETT